MASQSASRLSYYTLYQVLLLMDFYLKFFFDYITFFFEKKENKEIVQVFRRTRSQNTKIPIFIW